MIFDTDVFIWCLRGDRKAAARIDQKSVRRVSVVTLMELQQGARNKREQRLIRRFLADLQVEVLPLTENIGHRASIYVEKQALTDGLRLADALVAATAVEQADSLCTGNAKHYRVVGELDLVVFKPTANHP